MVDSVFEGVDGWVGHGLPLGDFVLEGEFFWNGQNQGGIVLRGDRESWFPWLCGYEMDIDEAQAVGEGHIHFPCRPQPYVGEARFAAGAWQRFTVRAIGRTITVSLNGVQKLKFSDDHYRYGQICLEGEKGGVRYRKLRVQKLDKKPPEGPRSPWVELFDGDGLTGWAASGSVSAGNGAIDLDGSKGRAEVRLGGRSIVDGAVELDVWCRRSGESRAPYRISLRTDSVNTGACFTARPECVVSCGSQCSSRFPVFMATTAPEYWRFDLRGPVIQAVRFGDTVMTCANVQSQSGALAISADSCRLIVRGVRYREPEKKAAAGTKKGK